LGKAPNFIKIDGEGAELAVLEGARRTLAAARPNLLVEIHGWGTDESEKVLQVLSEFEYETHVVGKKGRERVVLCISRHRTTPCAPSPRGTDSIVAKF
jgi:hypothetical protein